MPKRFKQFLREDKNLHLSHLEDGILLNGIDGLKQSINFLKSIRDMLSGNSSTSINITVKWDGAPAIVCGQNPENGKFFVGTKSVFNKRNPKINYNDEDIDRNHEGELAEKLRIILKEFPSLGIKGILQGDLLYTKKDLKIQKINDENLLTFRPNTILYAVPNDSQLAKRIKNSYVGVVFHTQYHGPTISELKASYGFDVSSLNQIRTVWVTDANFRDTSGSSTMTNSQTEKVNLYLNEVDKYFKRLDGKIINLIAQDKELRSLIMMYQNSQVRKGKSIGNVKSYVKGLVTFIVDRYQKEIDKLKTLRGKSKKKDKLSLIQKAILINQKQLYLIFEIQKSLVSAKLILIRQLEKAKNLGTFIETTNGFKVTTPEGFVSVDRLSGDVIKLVDRLEFSRLNFTIDKNWSK